MADPDLTKLPGLYSELATATFNVPLFVPDGAGSTRPPLLVEITALEMSVYLLETGEYITAWIYIPGINPPITGTWEVGTVVLKNVDVKNTGRGAYNESTGILVITLHAGDQPCIADGTVEGAVETHRMHITGRYNSDVDQFHARADFKIKNLGKVPRVP